MRLRDVSVAVGEVGEWEGDLASLQSDWLPSSEDSPHPGALVER